MHLWMDSTCKTLITHRQTGQSSEKCEGVKRASTEHSQQKAQHFWVSPSSGYFTNTLACKTAAAPRAAYRRYERRYGILMPGRACVRKRLRWRPYPPHCSSAPWPTRTTRAAERYTPPAQYVAPRSSCVSATTHGPTVTVQKHGTDASCTAYAARHTSARSSN